MIRGQLLGTVVALTLVAAGGVAFVVQQHDGTAKAPVASHPTDEHVVPTPTPTPPPPTPPRTRTVGFDGVAIAVPASWTTNGAWCQSAAEDTVIVGENRGEDCGFVVETGEVSSAHLLPDTSIFSRRFVNQSVPDGAVDGVPVSRFSIRATWCNPEPTRGPEAPCHMYEGALVFQSLDVTIWVRSPDREIIRSVLDSTFVLGPGYVAVPDQPTQQSLARLGFAVHEQLQYRRRLIAGWLLNTSPEVGSIVPLGSSVTLTFSTRVVGNPCAGLRVELVTPARERALSTVDWQHFTARVHVGDVVSVHSAGACAETVTESSRNTAVLRGDGDSVFTAMRLGTSRLLISMPMCAGARAAAHCIEGTIDFADVTVLVEPR